MIIEIRRAGFVNKGAELMLRSILERLQKTYPNAIFTMAPSPNNGSQPFRKIVDAGMYPKAALMYRTGILSGRIAKIIPKRLREMYGIILDQEVDVVIDAAGFAYSDQWEEKPTVELAQSVKLWRKQGTTVIMMPQALGPYENTRVRDAIKRAANNVDLIMPRDSVSYKYLTDVTGERDNIRQYPDFTNLISGSVPDSFDVANHGVCLVPNYRMIDKTTDENSRAYLPFMIRCATRLLADGSKPFILIHEGAQDQWLADEISKAVGGLPILVESDPLKIKGVLGVSRATIGSRFHGLVSALSQGVPSLATGWSHKYHELMKDYAYPEGMVSLTATNEELERKIQMLTNPESNAEIALRLQERSTQLKQRTEQMWREVIALIDRKCR